MRYTAPKSTHDILPAGNDRTDWADDIAKWHWMEDIFRTMAVQYGFEEIRTPVFEATDLFKRAVGEGTDIVSKEMYDFVTKGNDAVTLRPEGTAPALRAYVQHRLWIERPVAKLYYIASIFRYEQKQKGRYRQHHQIGVEVLGAQGPDVDAEVIALAMNFLRRLGITRLMLKINSVGTVESRARYLEALRGFAEPLVGQMSSDNQRRFQENALRMLDSKDERDQRLLADAPLLRDYLDDESKHHFESLLEYLTALGISYEIDPRLVRGFDYYTKTAFEIQSPDVGSQSALSGGGRYDRLVADLGGPATPGIGFGLGIERVLIALQAANVPVPDAPGVAAFFCPLGDSARKTCLPLMQTLRAAGVAADMDYTGRKLKVMLEQADRKRARYAVIIGDDEISAGTAQVREIGTGAQRTVNQGELATALTESARH